MKQTRARIGLVILIATSSVLTNRVVAQPPRYPVLCSYAGRSDFGGIEAVDNRNPAFNAVRDITDVLGIAFIPVYRADVGNAAATVINNQPAILYAPEFLNWLQNTYGRWAALSVLAHEVGHHYDGDTSWFTRDHPWTKELKADFISGFVLARLGMPVEAGTSPLCALFDPHGSESHPDTAKRVAAVEAGWERGGGTTQIRSRIKFVPYR